MGDRDLENCKTNEKTAVQKIIDVIDFISDLVNRLSIVLVVVSGVAMCITLLAAVFSRYLLGKSFLWTDEVGRMIMIFVTFIGASIAYKNYDLTNMAFLQNLLPALGGKILLFLVSVLCIVFFFVFGVQMIYSMPLYQNTIVVVTKVPQSYPAAGIIYGCFAMVIHGISHLAHESCDIITAIQDK